MWAPRGALQGGATGDLSGLVFSGDLDEDERLRKRGSKVDKWLWRPVVIALPVLALIKLLIQLPGDLNIVIIPLSLLAVAAALGALIWAALAGARRAQWRRAVSFLAVPVLVTVLWSPLDWIDDRIHLWLTVTFGVGQIGPTQDADGGRYRIHDWSTGLAGGPNTFLIEDPSDRVAGPVSPNSAGDESVAAACTGKVERLWTHFYVCTL